MTYSGLRSTADIKKHHCSFRSKLSNFFPSKFSFYACEIIKEIQASGIEVLHRQTAVASKNIVEEYM